MRQLRHIACTILDGHDISVLSKRTNGGSIQVQTSRTGGHVIDHHRQWTVVCYRPVVSDQCPLVHATLIVGRWQNQRKIGSSRCHEPTIRDRCPCRLFTTASNHPRIRPSCLTSCCDQPHPLF